MGGEGKEESGFGFKDKAKAQETLVLLQQHDPAYRALTVRGLLGRARRVLSMTKAEEKIKNIKEAIAVFEEWTQQQKDAKSERDGKKPDKEKKKEANKKRDSEEDDEMEAEENPSKEKKKSSDKKADTVPGLGYKDAAAARGTLRALEGRDPNYQRLAVKGLLGGLGRTLAVTRDETKKKNLEEAREILEEFVSTWEREGRGKDNLDYLPLDTVLSCLELAAAAGVTPTDQQTRFVEAYRAAGGDYKRLRTARAEGEATWDVVRNAAVVSLRAQSDAPLSTPAGPAPQHIRLALWAYSPAPHTLAPTRKRAASPDRSRAKKSKA